MSRDYIHTNINTAIILDHHNSLSLELSGCDSLHSSDHGVLNQKVIFS